MRFGTVILSVKSWWYIWKRLPRQVKPKLSIWYLLCSIQLSTDRRAGAMGHRWCSLHVWPCQICLS